MCVVFTTGQLIRVAMVTYQKQVLIGGSVLLVVVVVVVVVHLYSASRSASNALIVPQRCEEMSL